MPTDYVKKLAKKHKVSVSSSESKWKKAKSKAKDQGHEGEFAYITNIYKKMMGEDAKLLGLKEFLVLSEWDKDDEYTPIDDKGEYSTDEGDKRYKSKKLRKYEEGYDMMTDIPLMERRYKSLEKAAADTYHRDYMKTRDRKYRKYSAKRRGKSSAPTHVEEGVFDYMKGAGSYFGRAANAKAKEYARQVVEPVQRMHNAGIESSRAADRKRKNTAIQQNILEYAKLVSYRNKLRTKQRQFGITEGILDYFRGASTDAGKQVAGAAKEFGGAVKEFGGRLSAGAKNIHDAGRIQSLKAEDKKAGLKIDQLVKKIADIIISTNEDQTTMVSNFIHSNCADIVKNEQNRNNMIQRIRKEVNNRRQNPK